MSSKTNQKTQLSSISKANDLIGKLCDSRFAYYDNRSKQYKYKLRPVLVIGVEKEKLPCDITVFPVSKVSREENIHKEFDFPLTKKNHSKLQLKYDPSYVRVHKVNTIHSNDLSFDYTDSSLNSEYPNAMSTISEKYKEFSESLF